MTDDDLRRWWPALAEVVAGLRSAGHADAVEALAEAVRAGTGSAEVLGGVGVVLWRHRALRARLDAEGRRAWDAVLADAHRRDPLARLRHTLARWTGGLGG